MQGFFFVICPLIAYSGTQAHRGEYLTENKLDEAEMPSPIPCSILIWLFTKIQTVLRLTIKFPRILREPEIHLSILLGNQNFLAQPHNIHLSVGTPLLLLPFPCGKRLQTSQISHKGSLFHRTCGIPGRRWKWGLAALENVQAQSSKKSRQQVTYQKLKIPSSKASRKREGDSCFWPHSSVMGRQKRMCGMMMERWGWNTTGNFLVRGSLVSGFKNLSRDMWVWYQRPTQPSRVLYSSSL